MAEFVESWEELVDDAELETASGVHGQLRCAEMLDRNDKPTKKAFDSGVADRVGPKVSWNVGVWRAVQRKMRAAEDRYAPGLLPPKSSTCAGGGKRKRRRKRRRNR